MNTVVILGNLTRDPELRYLPNGTACADLSLAVNSRYHPKDGGEIKEEVDYFTVTAWGKSAENAAEYLAKGSKVLIQGKLKQERWEKDGQKHSRVKIMAQTVEYLSKKKDATGEDHGQPAIEEEIPF
jgi:single-strand DNA-binding protein